MSKIDLSTFTGIFPRASESLLPANAATVAQNIDFSKGELNSLAGHYLVKSLSNSPAAIFSEDGIKFYSWPVDADVEISPFGSGPMSDLLYYTYNGDFRVAQRSSATVNGGLPGTSFRVGVPRCDVAPIITVEATTLPVHLQGITPVVRFHYEDRGLKYQETTVTATPVSGTNGTKYAFTAPARLVNTLSGEARAERMRDLDYDPNTDELDDPTPVGAIPVVRFTFTTSNSGTGTGEDAHGEVKLDQFSSNSQFSSNNELQITLSPSAGTPLQFTASIGTEDAGDMETRSYVITATNLYGEEGPPSPPTTVNVLPGASILVGATIPNASAYVPLKSINVHRTQNGGTDAEYYYAYSINVLGMSGVVTERDMVSAKMLNEPLASYNYYPPKQNLKGLRNVGNGIFAAWFGTELWFSDAFKPWSWPPQYMKSFGFPIVGAEVQGTGLVVTTLGNPYFVNGVSPDSMTQERLNSDQAGLSKWSIASVGGRIIYASNDGLVTVDGGSGSLSDSMAFFTREVWRDKYKAGFSTMQLAEYDGALIVFSRTNAFTPFMIRFDEAKGSMCELPGFVASTVFYSVTTDGLFFASGNNLYEFAGGADVPFVWQSKEMILPEPECFLAGATLTDGTFSVEMWTIDDAGTRTLRSTQSIAPSDKLRYFRLPSGYKAMRLQIKISGTGRFRSLKLGHSRRHLVGE